MSSTEFVLKTTPTSALSAVDKSHLLTHLLCLSAVSSHQPHTTATNSLTALFQGKLNSANIRLVSSVCGQTEALIQLGQSTNIARTAV